MKVKCSCGKGYASRYDDKCGHCRTQKEKNNLQLTLQRSDGKSLKRIKQELNLRNSDLAWMIKQL